MFWRKPPPISISLRYTVVGNSGKLSNFRDCKYLILQNDISEKAFFSTAILVIFCTSNTTNDNFSATLSPKFINSTSAWQKTFVCLKSRKVAVRNRSTKTLSKKNLGHKEKMNKVSCSELLTILKPVHWFASKSMDWFLYDWDLRHERAKSKAVKSKAEATLFFS